MSWRAELPAWLRIRFLDDLAIEAMLERLDGLNDRPGFCPGKVRSY